MSVHLSQELKQIKKEILALGETVKDLLTSSIQVIKDCNLNLANEIIKKDSDVDQKEVYIEECCLKVLALHQPVAMDLRFIVAVLKVNNDLERVGDLAVNISRNSASIVRNDFKKVPFDYEYMSSQVVKMLTKSLEGLAEMDLAKAHEVCEADDEIDELNWKAKKQIRVNIKNNPEDAKYLLRYIKISENLERVADYATNISEDIIYAVDGVIVRHGLGEEKDD